MHVQTPHWVLLTQQKCNVLYQVKHRINGSQPREERGGGVWTARGSRCAENSENTAGHRGGLITSRDLHSHSDALSVASPRPDTWSPCPPWDGRASLSEAKSARVRFLARFWFSGGAGGGESEEKGLALHALAPFAKFNRSESRKFVLVMRLKLGSVRSVYLSWWCGCKRASGASLCLHSTLRDDLHFWFPLLGGTFTFPLLYLFPSVPLPLLYFPSVSLSPAPSSHRSSHNLPPETIPGLFCKSSTEHEFYMGCTQSSVNTLTDRGGCTLPVQPNTHAHTLIHAGANTHSPAWPHKSARAQMRPHTHIKIHNSPLRRILGHAANSEHRWNASDQRRSDGCLMFYWS